MTAISIGAIEHQFLAAAVGRDVKPVGGLTDKARAPAESTVNRSRRCREAITLGNRCNKRPRVVATGEIEIRS